MRGRKGGKRGGRVGNGFAEVVESYVVGRADSETNARKVAEGFHGRKSRGVTDIGEEYRYPKNLAELGKLVELMVMDEERKYSVPIMFNRNRVNETVLVTSTSDREQIVFVGGDQKLDWKKVLRELDREAPPSGRQYVELGEVYSIACFADKHHLEGPEEQKKGVEYEHEFGEEGGYPPRLVYDTLNEKMMLVGGSYTVEDVGIRD